MKLFENILYNTTIRASLDQKMDVIKSVQETEYKVKCVQDNRKISTNSTCLSVQESPTSNNLPQARQRILSDDSN